MTQAITDKQINAKADARKAREAEKYARKLMLGQAKPRDMEVFICGVLSSKTLRKVGFRSIKEQGRNARQRIPTSKQITPSKEVPEMPDNAGNISQAESASNSQNSLGNWQGVGSVAADLVKKVATK